MSLEKVRRTIHDEDAHRLADAAHDFERDQQRRFDALGVEVAKAINRSSASVMLASFTLATLLAGQVDETLRGLDERIKVLLERQQASLE